MRKILAGAASVLALAAAGGAARADEAACAALAEAGAFPDTTIESTAFHPAADGLPAFCEAAGVISPVEGSRIGVVYRLPETWNGKVLGLGGGGFSGDTALRTAAPGLTRGYATMQTDTGHPLPSGPMGSMDATWLAKDGELDWVALEDFGHRGLHLMTVVGKQVAAHYYGRPHDRAYYMGCSTGGRQGLMEAQRYPDDYEGVVAGAPIWDVTIQTSAFLRGRLFGPADARLSPGQAGLVAAAATAACDADDGLADGIISDPEACAWEPDALACANGGSGDACLNPAQLGAVKEMYRGVVLNDGRVAGQPAFRGGEAAWMFALTGMGDPVIVQENGAAVFLDGFGVDADALTPEELLDRLQGSRFAAMYDASNPDYSAYFARGGKLIVHHGWLDSLGNPASTVDNFQALSAATAPLVEGEMADHARLFMLAGTGHCGGGPGANTADWLTALEAWVEEGRTPDRVLATRVPGFGERPADGPALTRPLCPYPQQARHQDGDPNSAESFRCE